MERKTKYQYTYFIYPYLIEPKNYQNYLYKLLNKKECTLKLFSRKKDIEIDSYFMPEIKEKLFWSLDMGKDALKSYETMDKKMKSAALSKKACNIFEYSIEQDIPGKLGEENGIFFDINKIEIVCFQTGICFILIKTVLDTGSSFSDVLNFNYKFRDIQSKVGHTKEYDSIKIQTQKFNNMQTFTEFLNSIAGANLKAKEINLDIDRLITYSYTCLDQASWNSMTDIKQIEKDFNKYLNIYPAGEQIEDSITLNKNTYQEKSAYYGFSSNSSVLLTNESNIKNYTKLLFSYENEQLYHYIYLLHQKIYLKQLNYEFKQTSKFETIKEKFLDFAKKNWIYEITNDALGINLEKNYRKELNLEEIFSKLKSEYDLLYKEYEISKHSKYNKWIIGIVAVAIIINIVQICKLLF